MATFEAARRELEDPHRVLGFLDYIKRVWIGKKREEIVSYAKISRPLSFHYALASCGFVFCAKICTFFFIYAATFTVNCEC